MIVRILLILMLITTNDGAHFNGGTISWVPIYPSSNSSTVPITLTQSYSWVYPAVTCNTSIPSTAAGTYLVCVGNCSTANGFSNTSVNIQTDCYSWSSSLGLVFGSRSVNLTLNESTYFWIGNRGSAWRTLNNVNGTASWSIVSLIDLLRRPDGLINTPPIAPIASPQYVVVNTTTAIKIPVSDANTGDDIRCRWSQKNGSSGVDECASVCTPASTTSLGNLSNCTLTFMSSTPGAWYAIALQVEDFINTTSTAAMSSVSIQFLIYVISPNCSLAPVVLPLTDCLEVQVNVPVTYILYAVNNCNRNVSIITNLLPAVTVSGMTVSSLVNSTTNTSLVYVTLTWTPQVNQLGSQQFCATAYTSERVQSTPYCVTFNVISTQPCSTTTTSTTSTSTSTSATTTSDTTTTTDTTTTETTSTTTETTSTTTSTDTTTSTSETTSTTTSTDTTTSTSETTSSTISSTTSSSTTSSTTSTTSTTTSSSATSSTTSTTSTTTSSSTTSSTTSTTSTTTSSSTTSSTTSTTSTTTTTTTTTTTSTTTTSTTTTTVTTTTETTTTQTTITTITTTTTTLSSDQLNIPLIVGMSILGLLALSCATFWLYYLKWSARARRRRANQSKKGFSEGIDQLPMSEDIALDEPGTRSKNYIADDESDRPVTVNSFLSSNPEEPRPTSSVKDERIVSPKSVTVKKNVQLSKEENPLVELHPQQQNSDEHKDPTSVHVSRMTKFRSILGMSNNTDTSSVTVGQVKKPSSPSELTNDAISSSVTIATVKKSSSGAKIINDYDIPSVTVARVKKSSSIIGVIDDQNLPTVVVAPVKKSSTAAGINRDQNIPSGIVSQVKKASIAAGMSNDQDTFPAIVSKVKKPSAAAGMINDQDTFPAIVSMVKKSSVAAGIINAQEKSPPIVSQVKKPSSNIRMINDQDIPSVSVSQVKKSARAAGMINDQDILSIPVTQIKKSFLAAEIMHDQGTSSINVSSMKKSSSTELFGNNRSKKSVARHHEENVNSSPIASNIHVHVSTNQVSAYDACNSSTAANAVSNISKQTPSTLKTKSMTVKSDGSYNQGVQHVTCLKIKGISSPGQQRTNTFSYVDVRKIKPINDNEELATNNTKVSILHNKHNNNKVGAIDGVHVALVKKD